MASDEPKMTEHRIDGVQLTVTLGEWRGKIKVGEKATGQAIGLFAKDDGEPLAWGRALEELLERLIERANAGDMVASG
jgi:hypothetical protein